MENTSQHSQQPSIEKLEVVEHNGKLKDFIKKYGQPIIVTVGRSQEDGGSSQCEIKFENETFHFNLDGKNDYAHKQTLNDVNPALTMQYKKLTDEDKASLPTWDDYNDLVLWMNFLRNRRTAYHRYIANGQHDVKKKAEEEAIKLMEKLQELGYNVYMYNDTQHSQPQSVVKHHGKLKDFIDKYGHLSSVNVGQSKENGGSSKCLIQFEHKLFTFNLDGENDNASKDIFATMQNNKLTDEEKASLPTWDDYNDLVLWMNFIKQKQTAHKRHGNLDVKKKAEEEAIKLMEKLQELGYNADMYLY
jgi:hypothetical protein